MSRHSTAHGDNHRVLLALLIGSAFVIAGGIHYQTPMLARIASEFQASPAAVGWIPTLSFGGMLVGVSLFVPLGDRVNKRWLIIAALVNWAVSAIMLLLFVTSWLTLTHIIILSLVSSMTWALDNPTRQAFVPDLVGREDLTSAIALNAVAIVAAIFGFLALLGSARTAGSLVQMGE